MKLTKKVLASSVAASVLGMSGIQAANAEIELGEGLSVTGFVDMSYVYKDVDAEGVPTEKVFAVDQVEVDFMYTGSDGVSAQVDIEYGEGGEGDDTFVEQAFITKAFSDSFSVKAGRFLSYSGWETEEPTGLYQYSGAGYGGVFYGGYQQGVSAYFDGGMFAIMGSVVTDVYDAPADNDTTHLGTELGVAIMPVEGWTAKLFYMTDEEDDKINFWTSYEVASFTFAFEYNMADFADESEGDGSLLMANYAAGAFGITLRFHDWTIEDSAGNTTDENSGITIAPSFAMGDNLLIVTEYRMEESNDVDINTLAVEALYTF